MITARYGMSYVNGYLTLSNGTKVVVAMGGAPSATVGAKTEVYNTDTHQWVQAKDFVIASNSAPAAVVNNRYFIFGSQAGTKVHEYDAENDDWIDTGNTVQAVGYHYKPFIFNV